MKPTLVLPVAGRTSRFGGARPKWLLTHPRGTLMITESIRGLNPRQFGKIVVIALESHEKDHEFSKALAGELVEEYSLDKSAVKVVLLQKETSSQAETVFEGVKQAKISGPVLVKDSDNYFHLEKLPEGNWVSVVNLDKSGPYVLQDKSYVRASENLLVKEIVEKKIVSNLFCCGGYYFEDAKDFNDYFVKLKGDSVKYLSQVVQRMVAEGKDFQALEAGSFEDWGTREDWVRFKGKYRTLFVELDGVVVLDSSRHFEPKWGKTEALRRNVSIINKLHDSGTCEVILLSSRKESAKAETIEQLRKNSVKYHRVIFGLFNGSKRVLVTPYSEDSSFPAAVSLNTKLDDDRLDEFLQ
ncbi:MAG TPA: hypothetical protein VJA40_00020 [archaeon]|nr:hypothetical protein [archaeon]